MPTKSTPDKINKKKILKNPTYLSIRSQTTQPINRTQNDFLFIPYRGYNIPRYISFEILDMFVQTVKLKFILFQTRVCHS